MRIRFMNPHAQSKDPLHPRPYLSRLREFSHIPAGCPISRAPFAREVGFHGRSPPGISRRRHSSPASFDLEAGRRKPSHSVLHKSPKPFVIPTRERSETGGIRCPRPCPADRPSPDGRGTAGSGRAPLPVVPPKPGMGGSDLWYILVSTSVDTLYP
jgi:hypothetical protein